ncbi:MAG TPA: NADH-quinone oxidoreductase subunit F [Synergistaceae bacterium]|nr:NADH-quinone oxidoreductase subunit F [Synergistaceae bacterium]
MKFGTLSALRSYKEQLSNRTRSGKEIWVCGGPGCVANGSPAVAEEFQRLIGQRSSEGSRSFWQNLKVMICREDQTFRTGLTGCMGPCENGPIVHVEPEGWYYRKVTPEDAAGILDSLKEGRPYMAKAMYGKDGKPSEDPTAENIPFLSGQKKLVLGNMSSMSPLDLEDYLAHGGYSGLLKALESMTPEEVCAEVRESGLRGRGGGGFPAGVKWESCRGSSSEKRYVLVNGDEGDPGAFMDRALMEGDPFSVIEGLTIGAYAVGSSEGIIYVRHEYPLAVKRLTNAITILEEAGLLGKDILGTGFDFHVEICKGGGAFVCGESTALMTSIEGKPGVPRVKYIRSTEKGLWGSPTVLNNVETWANVPLIITNGSSRYRETGSSNNSGTKVFALVGKVKNTGLVEVPMGTTLREMIYGIGGGVAAARPFKAVQTGGPSGGCLPASMLDTPVDFDSLDQAGSMMGSGGMIVMDEDNCMVDVAHFYMDFICSESCGKCSPCRIGTKRLLEMLTRVTNGQGNEQTLKDMKTLATVIKGGALCALGQTAANPILSTMNKFPDEYHAHVVDKKCPAHVCKKLMQYYIDPSLCKKCSKCARNCPVSCISGVPGKEPYVINQAKCIKCGTCLAGCPFHAISKR